MIKCKKLHALCLIFSILVLFASPVFVNAAPTVSGNVLTWPDDGWYQVQRATTYETVCEGRNTAVSGPESGPCLIDTETYIVVNHTSGERFENITASGVTPAPGSVVVEGNIISGPNDGWYQVQNTADYTAICSGTSSCEVSPGEYVVINHTTEERFEGIVVEALSTDNNNSTQSPQVEGQVISWTDTGWHQVQNRADYSNICEGGTSCTVTAGEYVVINHRTGVRTELTVPGNSPETDPASDSVVTASVNLTVPAYVSNELVVVVRWGATTFNASWIVDETWRAELVLSANATETLSVTFYDRHGALVLADYEQVLSTGAEAVSLTLSADQFDASQWDDDGDGTSNLSEVLAGTDPLVFDETGEPETPVHQAFNLGDEAVSLMTLVAGLHLDRIAYFVKDLAYIAAQQTTLQWPTADYYQLQSSAVQPYATQQPGLNYVVCEGGTSCHVLPGNYTQINLTTGDRSQITVPFRDDIDLPHATILPNSTKVMDNAEPPYAVTVERTQYLCEHGGTLTTENYGDDSEQQTMRLINAADHDLKRLTERNTKRYEFDQCELTVNDTSLPSGRLLINGAVESSFTFHSFADYTGYRTNSRYELFEQFSMQAEDGLAYRLHGETESYTYYREDRSFFRRIRYTTLDDYQKTSANEELVESVSNGQYRYESALIWQPSYRSWSQNISGTVSNSATNGQQVSITTDPTLMSQYPYGNNTTTPEIPFNGTMALQAEDGSSLYINAIPRTDPTDIHTQRATYEYTDENGYQPGVFTDLYRSPHAAQRVCEGNISYTSPYRDSITKRLYCSYGGKFVGF